MIQGPAARDQTISVNPRFCPSGERQTNFTLKYRVNTVLP